MTDFTREQLETVRNSSATEFVYDGGRFRAGVADLAAFALALLDRVDEWEKVFGHIDKDPDTAGNKIIEARREIEAERDRLREENKSLREANEIDLGEKAPLIFENAELRARNEILREELRDAEEAIRYVAHGDGYDCYRSESSPEPRGVVGYTGVGGVWFAFPEKMQPAVRRALKQKE